MAKDCIKETKMLYVKGILEAKENSIYVEGEKYDLGKLLNKYDGFVIEIKLSEETKLELQENQ